VKFQRRFATFPVLRLVRHSFSVRRSAFSLSFVALAKKDVQRWLLALPLLFCFFGCAARQQEIRWTMINVSPGQVQADCHLLEFPNGSKVLIDIADAMDSPGTALAFLQNHKIKHINLVVISHFHKDHYGRLRDLIDAGIKVDRVACNLPASREQMDREHQGTPLADWDDVMSVLQFLSKKHIPYFRPKAGERLMDLLAGGVPIHLDVVCLYDGVHTPIGKTDINDTSIIVRLSYGATRALFTGDLNAPLGTWLAHSNFDLKADVLKVPHHGTEGCAPNAFFDRVDPKAALVPTPSVYWFSLRSKRIRDYFSDHHIPTYVSGINGNVTVTMTAQGFSIQAERGNK
jgi:competence protein ComEC